MKSKVNSVSHVGCYGDDDWWDAKIDGERRELLSNSPTCCQDRWKCCLCGHVCDCQTNDEAGNRVLTTATRNGIDGLIQDGEKFVCEKCLRQAR